MMKGKELGNNFEKEFSRIFHQRYCPVLVSSLLLRSFQAGEIDIAGLEKRENRWILVLHELKNSQYPGNKQWQRLKRAQDYLSRVLDIESKLSVKFCQKDEA